MSKKKNKRLCGRYRRDLMSSRYCRRIATETVPNLKYYISNKEPETKRACKDCAKTIAKRIIDDVHPDLVWALDKIREEK